jgi:hypothetical protein
MLRRPSLHAALAGVCACLVACGAETTAARCTPPPTPSPPSVAAGALTASADRAVVPLGGMLKVTVAVAGPLSYQAPCDGPVRLIVVDSADIHVDSVSPPAPRGTPCGAVAVAAGQTAHYDLLWTADPTLPVGAYRLVLTLGDQPALSLPVSLGLAGITCG